MNKYYEAVSVSEELPKEAGWYECLEHGGQNYFDGESWMNGDNVHDSVPLKYPPTEWLRPSADVERMLKALEEAKTEIPRFIKVMAMILGQEMTPEQLELALSKNNAYQSITAALEAGKIEG